MPRLLALAIVPSLLFGATAADARGRSNTQIKLPHNLYWGDVTGDSVFDFIAVKGPQLFVTRTSFLANGYLYARLPANIERVFSGRFDGAAKETLCAILATGKTRCYATSPANDKLVAAFPGPAIRAGDEAIVGDFDGDGKDEVLVYTPVTGAISIYALKVAAPRVDRIARLPSAAFVKMGSAELDLGDLSQAPKHRGRQLRVGNFGDVAGEGTRDDLLVYDPKTRAISLHTARLVGGRTTFVRALTTRSAFVRATEQVTVANVRGTAVEEVVLHDTATGAYRFFELASVFLPISTGPFGRPRMAQQLRAFAQPIGQLYAKGGAHLFWGKLKAPPRSFGTLVEARPGVAAPALLGVELPRADAANEAARDDAMVWETAPDHWHQALARWSAAEKQHSYRWSYTQQTLRLDEDQDGDGITTLEELGGYDRDGDGVSDNPLHEYGASPFAPDIFVEIDYMKAAPGAAVDHQMKKAAINLAIDEMKKKGINLHIFLSDAIPYSQAIDTKAKGDWEIDWKTYFDPIKEKYFTESRWKHFHYCLFAHHLNASGKDWSGLSRDIPSSDFVVTLGGWDKDAVGSVEQQAGTFLHELGHNLGLQHGFDDGTNYKPNHLSIMNYTYQTVGVSKNGSMQFLYSEARCDDLDESKLDESKGIACNGGKDTFRAWIRSLGVWVDPGKAVDFNGDGKISKSVFANLNSDVDDKTKSAIYSKLTGGQDEYARLQYSGGLIGKAVLDGLLAKLVLGGALGAIGGGAAAAPKRTRSARLISLLTPRRAHPREMNLSDYKALKPLWQKLRSVQRPGLNRDLVTYQPHDATALRPVRAGVRMDLSLR